MPYAYSIALAIVAIITALGVLHPRYNDTLFQRIGMALTCIGSVGEIWALERGIDSYNASCLFTTGVALFALATLYKKFREPVSRNRRKGDRRRNVSTPSTGF